MMIGIHPSRLLRSFGQMIGVWAIFSQVASGEPRDWELRAQASLEYIADTCAEQLAEGKTSCTTPDGEDIAEWVLNLGARDFAVFLERTGAAPIGFLAQAKSKFSVVSSLYTLREYFWSRLKEHGYELQTLRSKPDWMNLKRVAAPSYAQLLNPPDYLSRSLLTDLAHSQFGPGPHLQKLIDLARIDTKRFSVSLTPLPSFSGSKRDPSGYFQLSILIVDQSYAMLPIHFAIDVQARSAAIWDLRKERQWMPVLAVAFERELHHWFADAGAAKTVPKTAPECAEVLFKSP